IWPIARSRFGSWLIAQSIAYVALLVVLLGLYRSVVENQRSPRAFAPKAAEYSTLVGVPLLVHELPEEAAFYMPLHLQDGSDKSHVLILIDHSKKDPPASAKLFSDLLNGQNIRSFERIFLNTND